MPQDSKIYAVARVRSLEKGLIGQDRMQRIADSSLEEAVRMLQESGYGEMPEATVENCEQMIARELMRTAKIIEEVTPDKAVTDLFLLTTDVHNLKVLIKARLLDTGEEPALMAGGVYDAEKLKAYVQEHDYRDLPKAFAEALAALEKELMSKESPQHVSVALDGAYLAHAADVIAKKPENAAFLREYFNARADFDNVLALMRLRDMKAPREALQDVLLPAGEVSQSAIIAAYEQPFETLLRQVATGKAGAAIAGGLEEAQRTGHTSAIEKARDDHLMRLVKKDKYDMMSLQPVLGYYLAREQEAKCVRLIITAKRNDLGDDVIAERLRELYG